MLITIQGNAAKKRKGTMRGAGRHSRRRGAAGPLMRFRIGIGSTRTRITRIWYDTTHPGSQHSHRSPRARCSLGKARIVAAAFFPARARARGLDARAPRPVTPEAGEETFYAWLLTSLEGPE